MLLLCLAVFRLVFCAFLLGPTGLFFLFFFLIEQVKDCGIALNGPYYPFLIFIQFGVQRSDFEATLLRVSSLEKKFNSFHFTIL